MGRTLAETGLPRPAGRGYPPPVLLTLRTLTLRKPATSRRRRAKDSIRAGLFAVALGIITLNVALDTSKPHWRDPEFGHRLQHVKPLAHGGRPLLLILGSSRPQMGLSPGHLGFNHPDDPAAYNFSQSGYGPAGALVNYRRLRAAGVIPKYLIVEVLKPLLGDDGTVEAQFDQFPERFAARDYWRVRDHWQNPAPPATAWITRRAAAPYTFRFSLLQHAGGAEWLPPHGRTDFLWTQLRPDGWMPYYPAQYSAEERDRRTGGARAGYTKTLAELEPNPAAERLYRELIEEAKADGVRVAFLLMPESAEFRSWYPPEITASTQTVVDRLGDLAPVFDCSMWYDNETDFLDGHHLPGPKAEEFSRRLGAEMLGPWVRAK